MNKINSSLTSDLFDISPRKLEIGAGNKPRPGYIHHDIRPLDHIEIICDAKKFPEDLYEQFDEVFASHILEHFNRFEVAEVLKEWTRLIRVGGIIDIVVPDIREICRQFVNGHIDIKFFNYLAYGGNDYEFNIHKYGFDISLLTEMLNSLGFEIINSTSGIKWEERKVDRYCPMIRIIARKSIQQKRNYNQIDKLDNTFIFAGHKLNYFYHQGNCGFPPEPRTERTVEMAIANKWLSLAGEDIFEIGAVSCYYWNPLRVKRIIDPFDKHPKVTDRVSMMDLDLTGKNILSISTIEHIGKFDHQNNKEKPDTVIKALDKILNESPCFLITFPAMYNHILDQKVFNGYLPENVKTGFIIRHSDQTWEEVYDPNLAKKTYGKTLRSNGKSAGADAVVVLERGDLL